MLTIKLIFVNMSHQDSVSYAVVVDVTTPAISLFIFLIIVNKFKRIYTTCPYSLKILLSTKKKSMADGERKTKTQYQFVKTNEK